MKQLSGMDAAFLAAETANWPTHVASLTLLDPAGLPGGYSIARLKQNFRERLHLVPALRWRLAEPPLGLGRPYWIEDPEFDLDFHIRRIGVPSPGGREELAELAAELYRLHLDRTRPLWEWWVIEGLRDGQFACMFKFHHAYMDGMSGVGMTQILFDAEPDPAPVEPPPGYRWQPERVPGPGELLLRSLPSFLETPLRLVRGAGSLLTNLRDFAGSEAPADAMPLRVPQTSFNARITQHRSFAWASVPLSDVKRVRHAFGAKVNDVVLAICSGALRAYLLERGELPLDPLIASVPVNIRSSAEAGVGNQVSGMTASLATHVADPVERLACIRESTQASKLAHEAMGARTLMQLADTPPPVLLWLAIQFYSRAGLSRRLRVPYNLVISNVPGPPQPLYHLGARITGLYSFGICFDGAGLYVGLMSHGDQIDFGVLACKELVPDPWFIADGIRSSLDELVHAAKGRAAG
jgi:WS/DGAT/MGAT family acyltransferase